MSNDRITIRLEGFDKFYEEIKKKNPDITKKEAVKLFLLKDEGMYSNEDKEEIKEERKEEEHYSKPEDKLLEKFGEISTHTISNLIDRALKGEKDKIQSLENRLSRIEVMLSQLINSKNEDEDDEEYMTYEDAKVLVKYLKNIENKLPEKLKQQIEEIISKEEDDSIDIITILRELNQTGTLKTILKLIDKWENERLLLSRINTILTLLPSTKNLDDNDIHKVTKLIDKLLGNTLMEDDEI